MSPVGAPRGSGDGGVDLVAVARDAELLDQLAGRYAVPADDRVAGLLAALAAEVDDGLDELLLADYPAQVEAPDTSAVPLPARRRASRGLRATTVAVVVGATLSVSGVAAAVTGDPLAPYRSFVSAVTGGERDLPANAAQVARLQHMLTGTRARIAHGDLDGARADLAALRAQLASAPLSAGQRRSLAVRLAALETALGRAAKHAAPPDGHGNHDGGATPGPGEAAPGRGGGADPSPGGGTGSKRPKHEKATHPKASRTAQPGAGGPGSPSAADPSPDPTSRASTRTTTTPTPETAPAPAQDPTAPATASPTPRGKGHGPAGGGGPFPRSGGHGGASNGKAAKG